MPRFIAYYRVSTAKQGSSGLGLEAQQTAVNAYVRSVGGTVIRAYREIESGKNSDRPELAKALSDCRRSKAQLIIAKLDRLTRNVAFLSGLMEAGVDFVACDMPSANRLTLHIMAAIAEHEAKATSERTKAALAEYKARGGLLGSHRPGAHKLKGGPNPNAGKRAGEVARRNADAAYADLAGRLTELRAKGLSLREIADRLNSEGHTTRRGCEWTACQVARVLKRAQTTA